MARRERELPGRVHHGGRHASSCLLALPVLRGVYRAQEALRDDARGVNPSDAAAALLRPGVGPARARGSAARASPRARPDRAAATSSPVAPSSTTSGTAAARHATTGSPAAIASRNTMPNPSCTEGRQKTSAFDVLLGERARGSRRPGGRPRRPAPAPRAGDRGRPTPDRGRRCAPAPRARACAGARRRAGDRRGACAGTCGRRTAPPGRDGAAAAHARTGRPRPRGRSARARPPGARQARRTRAAATSAE